MTQFLPIQYNLTKSLIIQIKILNLNLSFTNGRVATKINDKQDDFYFAIVNFPFLDGDVPRLTFYGFQQGYRYHELKKA